MLSLYVRIRNFMDREEGQGMVEYAMIIGLIAVGLVAALTTMGGAVGDFFGRITGKLGSFAP